MESLFHEWRCVLLPLQINNRRFWCHSELRLYGNVWHCRGRISSLRLDPGGFPSGTRASGGSVKVPLSPLERIILAGELQRTEGADETLCQFTLPTFWPSDCVPRSFPPPDAAYRSTTHGRHMLSSLLPQRKDGLPQNKMQKAKNKNLLGLCNLENVPSLPVNDLRRIFLASPDES